MYYEVDLVFPVSMRFCNVSLLHGYDLWADVRIRRQSLVLPRRLKCSTDL